jgi:hypothetical protein
VLKGTILKGDHLSIISAKISWDWLNSLKSCPLKLLRQSQPTFADMILMWSPFKIVSVSAVLYPRWPLLLKTKISAILDTGRCWRAQFWKGITWGSFRQSLVEIGSTVSDKIFIKFHPNFFPKISSNGQNCSILSQKVPKF